MQARPDFRNPAPLHPGKIDIQKNIPMHNLLCRNLGNQRKAGRAPKSTVMTKLQQKKKAIIAQLEDQPLAGELEISPIVPKSKTILEKKKS